MKQLAGLALMVFTICCLLYIYEHYEHRRGLARWKDDVLRQCERKQAVSSERFYRSGHAVQDLAP